MPENKKTEQQKAMDKDCIFIVAALIAAGMDKAAIEALGKCRGPACGQYAEFVNKCGFAK